jgi:hypothetical protein
MRKSFWRSFFEGIACIFDILPRPRRRFNPPIASTTKEAWDLDRRAIKNDWQVVQNDLDNALKKIISDHNLKHNRRP